MTNYVLITPEDEVHPGSEKDGSLIDLTAGVRQGYRWLPVENVSDATGYTDGNPFVIYEKADPFEAVLADKVTRTTIKRDMTQAETDAQLSQQFDGMDEIQTRAILALYKICWALWTNAGGNATQLTNTINNSPVTVQAVKDRVLS